VGTVALAALLALVPGPTPAAAREGMWSLSLRSLGSIDFKPGNDWFFGPQVGYSNYHLGAHGLEVKAGYFTTRMEAAYRNTLKYDLFLLSPTWHFRRNAFFDPTLQVDLGYARFDTEFAPFEGLDNDTWQVSLQPGLSLNLFGGIYNVHYHLGYNFITPTGHLFLPAVFGIGLGRML
jgi:hypothetical protein